MAAIHFKIKSVWSSSHEIVSRLLCHINTYIHRQIKRERFSLKKLIKSIETQWNIVDDIWCCATFTTVCQLNDSIKLKWISPKQLFRVRAFIQTNPLNIVWGKCAEFSFLCKVKPHLHFYLNFASNIRITRNQPINSLTPSISRSFVKLDR